jgi:hypothetical protein
MVRDYFSSKGWEILTEGGYFRSGGNDRSNVGMEGYCFRKEGKMMGRSFLI